MDMLLLLLLFCHKGGVICINEVTDISPDNLHSSWCFMQPSAQRFVWAAKQAPGKAALGALFA